MAITFRYLAAGTCQSKKHNYDAVCIFYDGRRTVDLLEFYSEVEAGVKSGDVLADCIVVLADKKTISTLIEFWKSDEPRRRVVVARGERAGIAYIKAFYFCAIDLHGLSLEYHDPVGGLQPMLSVESLVAQGLHALVRRPDVVQIAPAGHVFKHPSGKVNKLFIQARELARLEPEMSFVASAICALTGERLRSARTVFIDTMGIYHIVREALDRCESEARIESFHSYDEMKHLARPPDDYFCVISASTSGGMAKALVEEYEFDEKSILTLIDVASEGRKGSVLIPLISAGIHCDQLLGDVAGTEIELYGEHFSAKAKPPRAITLSVRHKPNALHAVLKHFGNKGVRGLNEKPFPTAKKPQLISVVGEMLVENQEFTVWLKAELSWSLSISVDTIVHVDDPASKLISGFCKKIIEGLHGGGRSVSVYSHATVDKSVLKESAGVLVVSAIAGDGGILRELARDLREFIDTHVPRHFLMALGLPKTTEKWSRLIEFLERNPTNRKYGCSTWMVLPIGGEAMAWGTFDALASRAQVDTPSVDGVADDVTRRALDCVADALEGAKKSFLKSSTDGILELTDGYVFLGDLGVDHIGKSNHGAIYLSIASVLQCAREHEDENHRLKPSGYESVVISPECFLRFNDAPLQAAILRAAQPSELDYSASPEFSQLMKEFLEKIFARHEDLYGSAALEFSAAMAIGKLRLKDEDMTALIDAAISKLSGSDSVLLGMLLLTKNSK